MLFRVIYIQLYQMRTLINDSLLYPSFAILVLLSFQEKSTHHGLAGSLDENNIE